MLTLAILGLSKIASSLSVFIVSGCLPRKIAKHRKAASTNETTLPHQIIEYKSNEDILEPEPKSQLQFLWYGIYPIKNPLCYLSTLPLINWHSFETMKFELQNAKPIASYIRTKKSFVQQLEESRSNYHSRMI